MNSRSVQGVIAISILIVCSFQFFLLSRNISTFSSDGKLAQLINLEDENDEKKKLSDLYFKGIHIIGERYSGNDLLLKHLKDCFDATVDVKPFLTRYQHWFQYNDQNLEGRDYGLIIAQFRNPYDWFLEMNKFPLYAPLHWDVKQDKPLQWKIFLSKIWSIDIKEYPHHFEHDRQVESSFLETEEGRKVYVDHGKVKKSYSFIGNVTCYSNFKWSDVNPCSMKDREEFAKLTGKASFAPVYELNHIGSQFIPYQNILELRRDKVLNFLQEVPSFDGVSHVLSLRYEDILTNGTKSLIRQIERTLGVKSQCQPILPALTLERQQYPKGFVEYINKNLDWDVEKMAGYQKIKH